jgi:hypothetical protein
MSRLHRIDASVAYHLSPVAPNLLFLLRFQLRLEVSEWIMCRHRFLHTRAALPTSLIQQAGMLVFVAIDAEQFPVAAVQWVVVVIVIFMMHRELAQAHPGKLATAAPTNPGKQLECALAISSLALIAVPARFRHNAVEPGLVGNSLLRHT